MKRCLEEIQELMNWGFRSTVLPIHLFYEKNIIPNVNYYTLCTHLDEIYIPENNSFNSAGCIWFDSDFPNIFYGILYLDESYSCIAGPCCLQKISPKQIRQYTSLHKIENITIPESSVGRLEALLLLLASIFQLDLDHIPIIDTASNSPKPETAFFDTYQVQQYNLDQTEIDFAHHSFKSEQALKQAFINGDEQAYQKILLDTSKETYGTMSKNPLKQAEYTAAIGVSLFSRYAMEAGVDQYVAYNLNDLYLQKISEENSPAMYEKIFQNASSKYMAEIKKAREQKSQSPYIEKCKQYVYKHLNKNFTLNDMAEYVGLSPTYLSSLFSNHEQLSIKEYTLQKRIDAAKNMLKYSDYTISQISFYFCFCSQSHFTEVFRKQVGETPSSYRKREQLL